MRTSICNMICDFRRFLHSKPGPGQSDCRPGPTRPGRPRPQACQWAGPGGQPDRCVIRDMIISPSQSRRRSRVAAAIMMVVSTEITSSVALAVAAGRAALGDYSFAGGDSDSTHGSARFPSPPRPRHWPGPGSLEAPAGGRGRGGRARPRRGTSP